MIIGDPKICAIESGVVKAYERLSLRALGFFLIHVGGQSYGVYKPDASMLACSFDEVERRIMHRGVHTAPFVAESSPKRIVDAFCSALFAEEPGEGYFGIPLVEFRKLFSKESNDLVWAPDGDEAFDDGSYVLQFDVEDRVRIIAFKCAEGPLYDPKSLSDIWLNADKFYSILTDWRNAFEAEWETTPKVRADDEG
jgi:hypothetical protein